MQLIKPNKRGKSHELVTVWIRNGARYRAKCGKLYNERNADIVESDKPPTCAKCKQKE